MLFILITLAVLLIIVFVLRSTKNKENFSPVDVSDKGTREDLIKVRDPNLTMVHDLKIGDSVKTWFASRINDVIFYPPGTVGGEGKLGYVSSKQKEWMIKHLKDGSKFECTIAEIKNGNIFLKFNLKSKHQLQQEEQELDSQGKAKLATELEKKYTPKTSIKHGFTILESSKMKKGGFLEIDIKNKQYYIENHLRFDLYLIDPNSQINVGKLIWKREVAIRILKAHFNKYKVTGKVLKLDNEHDYGQLEINFQED